MDLNKDGYVIQKDLVEVEFLKQIRLSIEALFKKQIVHTGAASIVDLFNDHNDRFMNCAKHAQWNLQLHHLGVMLGYKISNFMHDPLVNICTRPVVYFNNIDTSKKHANHTLQAHQDSKSMQGSSDALVCWVPLAPLTDLTGTLEVVPGSHLLGDVSDDIEDGFGYVTKSVGEYVPVEMELGDVLIFDSKLVHRSGKLYQGSTRWSCHFRYNNMYDSEFIERGYPHPYIYKPVKL